TQRPQPPPHCPSSPKTTQPTSSPRILLDSTKLPRSSSSDIRKRGPQTSLRFAHSVQVDANLRVGVVRPWG
ncbi:hypothetical protein GT037_010013, partial [Alternaria burnsii]